MGAAIVDDHLYGNGVLDGGAGIDYLEVPAF